MVVGQYGRCGGNVVWWAWWQDSIVGVVVVVVVVVVGQCGSYSGMVFVMVGGDLAYTLSTTTSNMVILLVKAKLTNYQRETTLLLFSQLKINEFYKTWFDVVLNVNNANIL